MERKTENATETTNKNFRYDDTLEFYDMKKLQFSMGLSPWKYRVKLKTLVKSLIKTYIKLSDYCCTQPGLYF
jgi:hypothetical protein